jgi:hypothetical protein
MYYRKCQSIWLTPDIWEIICQKFAKPRERQDWLIRVSESTEAKFMEAGLHGLWLSEFAPKIR